MQTRSGNPHNFATLAVFSQFFAGRRHRARLGEIFPSAHRSHWIGSGQNREATDRAKCASLRAERHARSVGCASVGTCGFFKRSAALAERASEALDRHLAGHAAAAAGPSLHRAAPGRRQEGRAPARRSARVRDRGERLAHHRAGGHAVRVAHARSHRICPFVYFPGAAQRHRGALRARRPSGAHRPRGMRGPAARLALRLDDRGTQAPRPGNLVPRFRCSKPSC